MASQVSRMIGAHHHVSFVLLQHSLANFLPRLDSNCNAILFLRQGMCSPGWPLPQPPMWWYYRQTSSCAFFILFFLVVIKPYIPGKHSTLSCTPALSNIFNYTLSQVLSECLNLPKAWAFSTLCILVAGRRTRRKQTKPEFWR
jgi:hypothetical protein